MKLEEITEWEDIRNILDKNFKHEEDDLDLFSENKNCENCKKYLELVNYQQELASTKYKNNSPMEKLNNSFQETIKYLKTIIK